MKINGTGPVHPSAARRKGAAKGPNASSFATELSSPSPAVGGEVARQIEALGGLLALQEVADPTEERRRGKARGDEILASLDQIRLGLLDGRIPVGNLKALVKTLRDDRIEISDPGLRGVLQEIELRAAVELAKLGQMA